MTPLLLQGMHGLGDNLHERALVRELMRTNEVWLKTSWPQLFWDLERDLHLLPLKSPIAWMAKNEIRTAALYGRTPAPSSARTITNGYLGKMPKGIADYGSVLGTMANICGVQMVGDFRLPIAPAWRERAEAVLARLKPTKPILIYRPQIAISEANRLSAQAKIARNPDAEVYRALYAAIRDRYFVISLADVTQNVERLIGEQIEPDAAFHAGELNIEEIAALVSMSAMVLCSPGFMAVLAQAVGARSVCVFGGFEDARSFSAGARFTPTLSIEPIHPCACWLPACAHSKEIDMQTALARIAQFTGGVK